MNFEQARINMIKQQFRTCSVIDDSLLNLLQLTPREAFVPKKYLKLAYADMTIPLPHDQVMLTPWDEAFILQTLAIDPTDRVLEIGTGTGYYTCLLAQMAKQVDTLDIFPDFVERAQTKLDGYGIRNIEYKCADVATMPWQGREPYDVIVMTGSMPFLPDDYL